VYPKITIVTCTYNRVNFLKKALESVEKQTYKNIEHIINDSNSDDGTSGLIQEYIKKNNSRYDIKLLQGKSEGISKALNLSLQHATGDIIHFLHDDVYYLNEKSVERAADYFKNDSGLE
jgi:glycosyltransferase